MVSPPALRVLVQIREALARRVAEAVPEATVVPIPAQGDVPPGAAGEILLTLPWGAPNLEQVLSRGVRWIHVLGTGIDRFPLHLLTDQTLTCSRGASAVPIAEWVLAVMLAAEKRLPEVWSRDASNRRALGTLAGRTLGLVGLGGIGTAVAARALPFGMRVLAYRRTAAPAGLAGVELVRSLTALARASDHVVIAAPSTPATRHLFDRDVFAAIKPGVHLVNVARGALVDADALREALDTGRVALASLDAVEPEPLPDDHWMRGHPRVRLSPHVSWHVPGAADLLVDRFIENLRRWQTGRPLAGVVDREAGY